MSTESQARIVLCAGALVVAAAAGCSPYSAGSRDYYGAVDPVAFAAPYNGGDAVEIDPVAATVRGQAVGYYSFPLPPVQAKADDPLALSLLPVPLGYVFDPTATVPFSDPPRCAIPAGYRYDQRTDAYRFDEQGNVFNRLPDDARYLPIVAEVAVTTLDERCQDLKSEAQLLADTRVRVARDGRYLAWPIVNPEAVVANPDGSLPDASQPPYTGLGPQKWGWYDHYLLAYLDGGYIPTEDATINVAGADVVVTRARVQKLYYPVSVLDGGKTIAGAPGGGYDVLEARPGDPAYSPICQVLSYVPLDPAAPARDAAAIDPVANQVVDTGAYLYCIQLR